MAAKNSVVLPPALRLGSYTRGSEITTADQHPKGLADSGNSAFHRRDRVAPPMSTVRLFHDHTQAPGFALRCKWGKFDIAAWESFAQEYIRKCRLGSEAGY